MMVPRILFTVFLSIILSGCATTHVTVSPYPDSKLHAPVKPDSVAVYRYFPTKRPFVRLGEVGVTTSYYGPDYNGTLAIGAETPGSVEWKLREAAAKLGADGVVITTDAPAVSGQTTNYGVNYNNSDNSTVMPSMVTWNGDPVPGFTNTTTSSSSALNIETPHQYQSGKKVYGIAIKFSDES